MPRRREPARLYLRKRAGRQAQWVILDGSKEISTGAGANEPERATRILETYLAEKHRPPIGASQPGELLVDEVMSSYLRDYAPTSISKDWIARMAGPILKWWSGKTLADVNGPNCRAYVAWRTSQKVQWARNSGRFISDQTARHELKCLRAAIRFYHREHGPLNSIPFVSLPPRSCPRDSYWLTRQQAAQRIRAARKRKETRHLVRVILIGLYTGTRPGAILRLGWLPSPHGGWFDLDHEVLYRRGFNARRTRKRQPPAKIHVRLLPHLRRWRAADLARGIPHVVHYQGRQVQKLRRSWQSVRLGTGQQGHDGPHILRHTAATWQMQWGTDLFEAAGYLGMTPETLWNEYGHHHPSFQANAAQAMPKKPVNQKRTG